MPAREWKLRSFITAIMVITTLITVLLVGIAVLLLRLPVIERENQRDAQLHADEYAAHVRFMLGALESRLEVLARTHNRLPDAQFEALLEQMAQGTPGIQALYLVTRSGMVIAAGLSRSAEAQRRDILGSDLSATPLFRSALEVRERRWSDLHLSALSGHVTVGLAMPAGTGHVLIAEVPLGAVLDTVRMLAREQAPPLWVLDSRGEVLIETGDGPRSGRTNLSGLPIFQASTPDPARIEFAGAGQVPRPPLPCRRGPLGRPRMALRHPGPRRPGESPHPQHRARGRDGLRHRDPGQLPAVAAVGTATGCTARSHRPPGPRHRARRRQPLAARTDCRTEHADQRSRDHGWCDA